MYKSLCMPLILLIRSGGGGWREEIEIEISRNLLEIEK